MLLFISINGVPNKNHKDSNNTCQLSDDWVDGSKSLTQYAEAGCYKKGKMENSSNSKNSEIFACEQKNLFLNDWSKKIVSKKKLLILLFKNVLKISNFKKSTKTSKNHKKTVKKTSNFFCLYPFTREEKISLIKKACFMLNSLNLKSKPSHLFWGGSI